MTGSQGGGGGVGGSGSSIFATPISPNIDSQVLEWRFPKPYHNFVLTGRSRAAWHTSFVIPQLNLLLDAGLCVNRMRPKHVFITHGHSDHSLLAPVFVDRNDPPDIYCPAPMKSVFNDFILAQTMLNGGGNVTSEDAESQGLMTDPNKEGAETGSKEGGGGQEEDDDPDDPGRTPSQKAFLGTHRAHGVRHGDVLPLRRLKENITATAFDCDHTVPCVGYVFHQTTQKLKSEYASTPGHELKRLKQSGEVDITAAHSVPIFAFLGDTTVKVLADEPEWLKQEIPVVITECSFLRDEHREQAERVKHTLWSDLEKVIRRWPKTTFVLMHFSMRYTESEIRSFFKDLPNCPENIVVWASDEPEA